MRRAPTLGIVIVLLLAWLASPPPARACSVPGKENWFVEVITFDGSTIPAGIEVISLATGERYEVVEIHNSSLLPVIILGQADRVESPIQAGNIPLPAGYVTESLILQNETRAYTFFDFLTLTRVQDKNISSYDPIDISQLPGPQAGQIVLIHGSHQHVVDFSIEYVVNQEFRTHEVGSSSIFDGCNRINAIAMTVLVLIFYLCFYTPVGLVVLVMGILFVIMKIRDRLD